MKRTVRDKIFVIISQVDSQRIRVGQAIIKIEKLLDKEVEKWKK